MSIFVILVIIGIIFWRLPSKPIGENEKIIK